MPLAKPLTRVVVRRSAPSGGQKCHSGLSTMGWEEGVPQGKRINKGWGAGDHFWRKAPENLRAKLKLFTSYLNLWNHRALLSYLNWEQNRRKTNKPADL